MANKKMKSKIYNFGMLLKERFKKRYIFLLVIIAVSIFFSYFYKGIKNTENFSIDEGKKQVLLDEEVKQNIKIDYNNPIEIHIKVGKNNPVNSTKYAVSLTRDDEKIVSVDLDTKDLANQQLTVLKLPKLDDIKGKSLILKIKGNNKNEENALNLYTKPVTEKGMIVNDKITDNSMYVKVIYPKYEGVYLYVIGFLAIASCVLLLLLDLEKLHNSIFVIILVFGVIVSFVNPVLDNPDEPCHLARTDLTSRGIFSITEESSHYRIANSVGDIIDDKYSTLETTVLFDKKIDNKVESITDNYANANLFLGYIPQSVGLLLGKLLGRSSMDILILGRIFNLIAYALAIRFAIKLTPIFKIPLSVISIAPMSIFIAGSYNSDATTYGLSFVLIAYFLYLYKKENVDIKQVAIFSAIGIVLGLVKLPYCMLGGLILFLPKSKFKDSKTYYISFFFVFLIAVISIGRGIFAMMITGASPYVDYYKQNNIDPKLQIAYIINNPIKFIKAFSVILLDKISDYNIQLGTLGWLTYGFSQGVITLSGIFIGSIMFIYPNEEVLPRKTKIGISIVGMGIYIATTLILYLTWTPVGSESVLGMQGRYLVPVIALLTLLSLGKREKDSKDSIDFKVIFISILFLIILVTTIMNRYY